MSYRDITCAGVAALRANSTCVVFDTRDTASYAHAHMDGAIALSEHAIKSLVQSRQPLRPILVYCDHGNSSREICQLISGFGFQRVHNLVGGWQAWQAHLAARNQSDSPLLEWMRAQGFSTVDPNARLDNGKTALMLAALKREQVMVNKLLELGADPNHLNDDDHHALWFGCVGGDEEIVSRLIAHGANLDNQNVNGATCAIYAASTGKLAILKLLVAAGADLSKETSGGYTALDSAATLPVLKYLRARSLHHQPA